MLEAVSRRRITLNWRAVWQAWVGTAVVLLCWWLLVQDFSGADWHWLRFAVVAMLLLRISLVASLGQLLSLGLSATPLAVVVDYRAGLVSCYRLRMRWKTVWPLAGLVCRLSPQLSHSGRTHFLTVAGRQGPAWTMKESVWWPLAQLHLLYELLAFEGP